MCGVIEVLRRSIGLGLVVRPEFGVAFGIHALQACSGRGGNLSEDAVWGEPLNGSFEVVLQVIFEADSPKQKRWRTEKILQSINVKRRR